MIAGMAALVAAAMLQIDTVPGSNVVSSTPPITAHTSIHYVRYNRVEALSVGGALRQQRSDDVHFDALLRLSAGDQQVNGELSATGRRGAVGVSAAGYRRLVQADDYGNAFGLLSSSRSALAAIDEFFYYRASGAEVVLTRDGVGGGALHGALRLFGEWQQGVGTMANVSLPWLINNHNSFEDNVIDVLPKARASEYGAQLQLAGARGVPEYGWRVGSAARLEAATGTYDYLRAATDLSVSRMLPAALRATVSGSIGASAGTLPTHRLWNLGGFQTLRGQIAGAERGDGFWMGHAKVEWLRQGYIQPAIFTDVGWAGSRGRIFLGENVLTSVGGGLALLGLPVRLDVARAIGARGADSGRRGWRVNLYAPVTF